MLAPIATYAPSAQQLQLAESVYRMVGRRDGGWQFDPKKIPLYMITGLFPLYLEFKSEHGASKDELDDLMNQMGAFDLMEEAA